MVAGAPRKRGSRFARVDSESFQQSSSCLFKGPNRRISRTGLDQAHRNLVCGPLRKRGAGIFRRSHSWFSRDRRSNAQDPNEETLRNYYSAAPRVGLQDELETTRAGLFSDVRFITGPLSRDVTAPEYLCGTPFDLVQSARGPTRKGRVCQHGASAAIHRKPSGGAAVARPGSPRCEHQQALLLQDVQESDWDEFHRLPLKSSSGKIEDAFAQSQLAN